MKLICVQPILGILAKGVVIEPVGVFMANMQGVPAPVPHVVYFDGKHWAWAPLPNFEPHKEQPQTQKVDSNAN
jgi:hypothetical protein